MTIEDQEVMAREGTVVAVDVQILEEETIEMIEMLTDQEEAASGRTTVGLMVEIVEIDKVQEEEVMIQDVREEATVVAAQEEEVAPASVATVVAKSYQKPKDKLNSINK